MEDMTIRLVVKNEAHAGLVFYLFFLYHFLQSFHIIDDRAVFGMKML